MISSTNRGVPLLHVIVTAAVASLSSHRLGNMLRSWNNVERPSDMASENERNLWEPRQREINWTVSEAAPASVHEDEADDENEEDDDDNHDDEGIKSEKNTESLQLMVDLDGIPYHLISSEDVVRSLMESVSDIAGARLRAHACVKSPSAQWISCFGILDGRGDISIYTWPQEQKALLNLQVIETDLVSLVEGIVKPFQSNIRTKFERNLQLSSAIDFSQWRIHTRGTDRFLIDLEREMTFPDQKYMVASIRSEFQQIDVLDSASAHDLRDLYSFQATYPEYVESHPELFRPNRALFLDGIVQSTLVGNAGYHEALVQPSLFAHPNPKRVAIIGGGECATLREVLKHNTIEEAVMIEIDPVVVEASKEYLPQWNDCSMFEGSARYCMDDKRTRMYNEDAFKWFMDRYLDKDETDTKEPLFDVIIMDALDPQNVVEFAKDLYGDGGFLKALYNALSDDGILVTQVGEAPDRLDPAEQDSDNKNRIVYANSLASQGFQSVADYMEEHAGFEFPWYFYAAFKDVSTRTNWMANEAEINLKIRKRTVLTVDGSSPLDFFDGSTMKRYQYPTGPSVDLFCRRTPMPPGCEDVEHRFDPEMPNYSTGHFYVAPSKAGALAGRGLFAKTHIPRGSYLMLESSIHPITFEASTASLIDQLSNHEIAERVGNEELTAFAWGYGYAPPGFGNGDALQVDSGILTFVNHGCNGTSNIGFYPYITDNTVDIRTIPDEILLFRNQGLDFVFNPAMVRNTSQRSENTNVHRDIPADEEVLENYYEQYGGTKDWSAHVQSLQQFCSGGMGEVWQYESEMNLAQSSSVDAPSTCSPNDGTCRSQTAETSTSDDVTLMSEQNVQILVDV